MHQIGPCPILQVEFDYRAPTDEAASGLFGSLLHPYWRESEAQLTEKQAVLLMHDIYMKRILMEQHDQDTFTTLIILEYINLPGDIHHPDAGSQMNLPRYSELHNCFSGIILFSLDIPTMSNTLKLFLFLLFLPEVFFTTTE